MKKLTGRFSKERFEKRIARLERALHDQPDGFDTALIAGRINQYYLTGTMQDGVFVLRSDGSRRLFVRKSLERAGMESPLDCIVGMATHRDMLSVLPEDPGRTFVDAEVLPLAMLERIRKHFKPRELLPLDRILSGLRAVKDPDEIALIEESGLRHRDLLERAIPSLLREGMSEADLYADVYAAMVKGGHHGLTRFSMFQAEMVVGQIAFGENSLYPTNFDGPDGSRGLHPAAPVLGSRDRLLKRGDIVFADVGYGFLGYHSDKTQAYCFGAEPPARAAEIHEACREVLRTSVGLIKPGVPAAEVYDGALSGLPGSLSKHFMGYGDSGVKFLGHGIGLQIDEQPVIMASNRTPLVEGMVIALEPKCGVEGIGMVGVEESYVIEASGARCVTGGDKPIMRV
ncbi:MAG: aminopeptidase P family protein [Spirochaetales bacterium]|nr:aminopeptidase P family protein [Spirochaetales bacterium]